MYKCINVKIYSWVDGQIDRGIEGQRDRWINAQIYRCTDIQVYRSTRLQIYKHKPVGPQFVYRRLSNLRTCKHMAVWVFDYIDIQIFKYLNIQRCKIQAHSDIGMETFRYADIGIQTPSHPGIGAYRQGIIPRQDIIYKYIVYKYINM